MTHIAVRKTSYRGTGFTESVPDMGVGDQGETLVAMNVRSEAEYKSDIVGSMPEGCSFIVIETADNNRVLVSSGNVTGWISTKTNLDQPLTKKMASGTGELRLFEAKVQLQVKEDQEFKSTVVATIDEGVQFEMIEEGAQNRVKIFCEGTIGWITSKTDLGQNLIVEVGAEGAQRMSKNLDTYVARQMSQSQFTKVNSSKSMGGGAERNMGKVRSNVSNDPRPKTVGAESPQEKAASPKLSKLAFCCST